MRKIVVLGASGVIGQHMRLCVPTDVSPFWVRREKDCLHYGFDISDDTYGGLIQFLQTVKPSAVVNLAGEGNVDEVGNHPDKYHFINVALPGMLAEFCQRANIHYVHVSSQAVYDGEHPPYHDSSPLRAINAYGRQKIEAEERIRHRCSSGWTIVRPSFVMGIRPIQHIGRKNPAEQMMDSMAVHQVGNRWFTACDANDVAQALWQTACGAPRTQVLMCTGTDRVSRFDLASILGERVSARHEDFKGYSPRPRDTTFAAAHHIDSTTLMKKLQGVYDDQQVDGVVTRAREISIFTRQKEIDCRHKLNKGFMALHEEVAKDFHSVGPLTIDGILEWYRNTHAYIWELSAYHLDTGFNYSGMVRGIIDTLNAAHTPCRVLNLGDGIGDMTLYMKKTGIDAVYHDLAGAKTSDFARMRLWMHFGTECETIMSKDWNPPDVMPESYDAVCAADFMEHLPNVEDWVRWILGILKPGGRLFTQNAFNCGSGPDGSIPMHLQCNDRFEHDWDPFLASLGFEKLSTNWYRKPALPEPLASGMAV